MYMQHLAINRTGIYRKATLNGRDHYVVPMSLIVPGVLSGSKGALHYPPDEISKNYDAWNGMPLVVNHPMHNGKPISARSAAVIDSHGIGTVLNARINSNGKLVAEGWFDIQKANSVDPRIISSIERGEQIELSTGLFTDNIPVKNGENAHHNGKRYTHVARNYRPDHLAILPDELGACSIKDGCGVGVINSNPQGCNQHKPCGTGGGSTKPITDSTYLIGKKVQFHEGEHKGYTVTIESEIPLRYKKSDRTFRGQIDGIKGGAGEVIVTQPNLKRFAGLVENSKFKSSIEAARLIINESWFKICPRKDGKCLPKGSAAGKKALAKSASKDKAPVKAPKEKAVKEKPVKEKATVKASKAKAAPKSIAGESVTPPSTKTVSLADTIPKGGKVAAAARVGVKGDQVPTPPPIPRLSNLTKSERKVEREFAKAYEKNPEKMADKLLGLIKKATPPGDPPTFGTDDAKVMHSAWGGKKLTLEQRSVNRATLNNALHATANAVTKKAFLKHLDTLKKGDEVLVTVGGCGAGKGFALKNVPKALEMKKKAKAVWDSAGDQNATENPWIQKELEKRGLKGNYVFVDADPKTQWAHPERGVVKRAQDPNDGRMVDAKVFADSYAHGAKNHQSFYESNKKNKNANFIFLENGATPKEIPGIPKKRLRQSAKKLADFSIETIARDSSIPPHVRRGATAGTRIWPEGLTANYGLVDAMIQNAKGMEQEFDDSEDYEERLDRVNEMAEDAEDLDFQVETDHVPMELDENGVEITDDEEPTENESSMRKDAGIAKGKKKCPNCGKPLLECNTTQNSSQEDVTENELSFSEITPPLEKALGVRFPGCYVNEVYKDHVIFRYAGNLYEVGYYVDDETDEIEISSEMPTVVRRVTTYKPVQLSSTIAVTNTEAAKLILNGGRGSGRKKGQKNKKKALSDKPFNRSSLLLTDAQSKAAAAKQKPAPTIDDLLKRGRKTLRKEAKARMFGADAMPTGNSSDPLDGLSDTTKAQLILNAGKKGWSDVARKKAALTRKAKAKANPDSSFNLKSGLGKLKSVSHNDFMRKAATDYSKLAEKASDPSKAARLHKEAASRHKEAGRMALTASKQNKPAYDLHHQIAEYHSQKASGGVSESSKSRKKSKKSSGVTMVEMRSFKRATRNSSLQPTDNEFSPEARAAALLARKKAGQAVGAAGGAVKAGAAAVGHQAKAGLKRVGGAYKSVFKAMLEKIKAKLGIKSKPVKMAKDKSGKQKADKAKAQSRLQKLQSKVKANKEARKAKKAAGAAKKAQKENVRAKVKAVTKQGKANKRTKQVAAFQAKKEASAKARSVASRASKNAAVKSKVASAKSKSSGAKSKSTAKWDKKETIQSAGKKLAAKGNKLEMGRHDLKSKTTYYNVTDKKGVKREVKAQDLRKYA